MRINIEAPCGSICIQNFTWFKIPLEDILKLSLQERGGANVNVRYPGSSYNVKVDIFFKGNTKTNIESLVYIEIDLLQWNLALVNFWVVKKLSLVNKNWWRLGSLYTINYMLNSKNPAIVKEFGDKIEFTIAIFHCTSGIIWRRKVCFTFHKCPHLWKDGKLHLSWNYSLVLLYNSMC